MADRNPWESPVSSQAPRAARNPWEQLATDPVIAPEERANPWESQPPSGVIPERNESNTLFGNAKAETVVGEIGAGIQKGVRQVFSTAPALAALATQATQDVTGANLDRFTQSFIEQATNISEGGAQRGIARVEDLEAGDPVTWLRYAAGTLGEAVPFVASIMAGGGGLRLLMSKMAARGVPASTRAVLARKVPAELVGGVATAAAIETGATAQELYSATRQVEPVGSVVAGTLKGGMEAVLPFMLGRTLGLTGQQATELADRLLVKGGAAKAIAQGIGTEAATEGLQEEIDIQTRAYFDENFDRLGPEALSRRINAVVAGGVGGGGLTAIAKMLDQRDPAEAMKDASRLRVRAAAGDVPIITGADANEMMTIGPEGIVRQAPEGLDATVSMAHSAQMDDILSSFDPRTRGLYATVIPGQDLTFGSQDQALNDGVLLGGSGYMRLDPSQVTRRDVSASVEDLPSELTDPRVEYLNTATVTEANDAMIEAIKLRNKAIVARSGLATEQLLQEASVAYRKALDLGARVEPFSDGQLVLRQPQKFEGLMQAAQNLQSQFTEAGLAGTVSFPEGGEFHLFQKGAQQEDGTQKGKRLDLELVNPDSISGVPSPDRVARTLATQEVSRALSMGRANGLGIRIKAKPSKQRRILRQYINLLQSMSSSTEFSKQPADVVKRFKALTDQGLRLDVLQDDGEFVVLEKLPQSQLRRPGEEDPNISVGGKRVQKPRARKAGPRVTKYLDFYDENTRVAFFTQLNGPSIIPLLAGEGRGQELMRKPEGPGGRGEVSPLGSMLREIVKSIGVPTDYVIQVVPPSVQKEGVKYEEKEVVLKPGGKPQKRSVISINPWHYAVPTKGAKPLTDPPNVYVEPGGRLIKLYILSAKSDPKQVVLPDGNLTTIGDARKAAGIPAQQGQRAILSWDGQTSDIPQLLGFDTAVEFNTKRGSDLAQGKLVVANGLNQNVIDKWRSKDPQDWEGLPKGKPRQSESGKAAEAIGTPQQKMTGTDWTLTWLFTDFAAEVSKSIVAHEWSRQDAATQELIMNAWRREMHLQKGTKKASRIVRTVPHPMVDRAINGARGAPMYDFEEWLIHQMTRYFTRPRRIIGPVEKFLNSVGTRVKRVIDQLFERISKKISPYNLDPLHGEPNTVVDNWLDRLQLRGLANDEPSFLDQGAKDALLKSIRANQAALKKIGINEYVVAAPQRASTYQVRKLLELLPKDQIAARHKLEGLLANVDKHNTAMEWLLGIHQMAEMNPHITGLKQYASLTRTMENSALSWATLADKRIREAQKLGKTQLNGLWGLMFDLDSMVYLDQKKLDAGEEMPRWPKPDELLTLVKKHGLKKDAFDVYVNVRNDYLQFLSQMEAISVKNAQETISDPDELVARIQEIRGETSVLRSRPYFPHMRFGRFAAIVKDGKGKTLHFSAYETKALRDAAVAELAVKYNAPQSATVISDEISDHLQQYQGLPKFALRNVVKALGLDGEDLTPQQAKDKRLLEALAEETTQTRAFRKQLLNRKNVPGYSLDGMRAYANYFGRSARFLARMEFQDRLQKSIQEVRESGSPIARDKRTRIADFMTKHFDAQMQPANDWANIRGLGFMWYFAFVPAAAFVNLTQVPMVTVPFLAGKFGDLRTAGNVIKAYSDNTRDYYKWLAGEEEHVQGPKGEAIEEAHFNRLIDDGFATELAAISQGPVLQSTIPGDKITRGLRRTAQWGTAPFAIAERINRSVSFRAAYDMALNAEGNVTATAWIDSVMELNKAEADQLRIDRGWDERHLRAYMAAAETVRKTQFEYGRWSRPKLMDGPRGVIFMFKTYLQNMLYFMFKTDRKVQVRFMLGLMATAGLMGLPGAEDATELAKWLARQMGYEFDFEREARKLMVAWGVDGAVAPDVIMHGASRVGFGVPAAMQGLGVPFPEVDLSGALSMGRIIPGLKEGLNPGSAFAQDSIGRTIEEWAGPVLGVPFEMYHAITDMSLPADDPKRWERMMPRALRAMSKSSRYLAEERERDRTGATVVDFDPNDWDDYMTLLATGAGFQPTEVTRQWDMLTAQREVQNYWKGQRTVLMSEFWRAVRLNDAEGKASAINAIKRFNEEAPDKALRINGKSLKQSLQNRAKGIQYKEHGIAREKSLRGVTQDVRKLFPEAVDVQTVPHK